MKPHVKGSNCVKWSQYTTVKISNKYQIKVSAHLCIFPSLQLHCSYISNNFWLFHSEIKALKKSQIRNVFIWMSGFVKSAYRVADLGKFPVWISKDTREFVRLPRVSDWARFAFHISKDEAPMPLQTVGLLFIFMHLSCAHLATLKIHSVSQTPLNFEQRTSPEVRHNSGNEATSLARIPFLFA